MFDAFLFLQELFAKLEGEFHNLLQKLDKFAIQLAVERVCFLDGVVFVAFEIVGTFTADVDAKNFATCGKCGDAIFEGVNCKRALVPVGCSVGGRECVLVDGNVKGMLRRKTREER